MILSLIILFWLPGLVLLVVEAYRAPVMPDTHDQGLTKPHLPPQ